MKRYSFWIMMASFAYLICWGISLLLGKDLTWMSVVDLCLITISLIVSGTIEVVKK